MITNKVILETNRTYLSKLSLSDELEIEEFLTLDKNLKIKHNHRLKERSTLSWLANNQTAYAKWGFGFYKIQIKSTGTTIGIGGFIPQTIKPPTEIVLVIDKTCQNMGLGLEVILALVQYGFDKLRLKEITFKGMNNYETLKNNLRYSGIKLIPCASPENAFDISYCLVKKPNFFSSIANIGIKYCQDTFLSKEFSTK